MHYFSITSTKMILKIIPYIIKYYITHVVKTDEITQDQHNYVPFRKIWAKTKTQGVTIALTVSQRAGDINEDSLHAYAQNSKRVRKKKVDLVVFVTYSSRYSDRNIAAANALKTRGQVCDDQTPIAMVDYRHGTMLHVLWRVLGIDCTGPLQCAGKVCNNGTENRWSMICNQIYHVSS